MEYISTQEKLEEFVQRATTSSILAIDTEFLREKTYYAQLCLIQLATDAEVVIVDPLSLRSLDALVELLANPSIVKLFHAGGQDLEILYHEFGVLPAPLFDTQVAATLLGYTQQIGYGPLVHSLCGVNLSKSDSYTDWSRRPLTASQLEYAANDVLYLPEMYREMVKRLTEKGRLDWLAPDFAALSDPTQYESDPRERFRRLKRAGQLNRKQLSAAREVAAWREVTAQERNIPRKWVLTDEQIVEACRRETRTIDELFLIRGMRERLTTRDAREVVRLMLAGMKLPAADWPVLDMGGKSERNVDAELDLMEALVRLRAKENDIALQTLATRSDLSAVARGYRKDVDVLKGWRRTMVGNELLDLLEGNISLSLDAHGLVVTKHR